MKRKSHPRTRRTTTKSVLRLPDLEHATMTTPILEPGPVSKSVDDVAERFQAVYETNPLGVFRAPGRVNLIGEHTGYNDGFVMPAAIDFFSCSAIARRADRKLSVYSDQFRETVELDLDQLTGPPRRHWSEYVRGVTAVLWEQGYSLKGANLFIDGQVPIGSGLSSSAAIEVSTALALTSLGGVTIPLLEVPKLSQRAQKIPTRALGAALWTSSSPALVDGTMC